MLSLLRRVFPQKSYPFCWLASNVTTSKNGVIGYPFSPKLQRRENALKFRTVFAKGLTQCCSNRFAETTSLDTQYSCFQSSLRSSTGGWEIGSSRRLECAATTILLFRSNRDGVDTPAPPGQSLFSEWFKKQSNILLPAAPRETFSFRLVTDNTSDCPLERSWSCFLGQFRDELRLYTSWVVFQCKGNKKIVSTAARGFAQFRSFWPKSKGSNDF